jgi:hypothetical protein
MMARQPQPTQSQTPTLRRWSLLLPSWATPPALLPHPHPKLPNVARGHSGTGRDGRDGQPQR